MGSVFRIISGGGQRIVIALGVVYIAVAAGLPILSVGGNLTVGDLVMNSFLLGASGLALSYGGYRLPRTSIRPDLFSVVATWCLRALGIMVGIVLLGALAGALSSPISGFVVLPALASVAGLGMGYHDARARTRALDAEERRREAERYSRELERYQTIVETVNDGIFVVDDDFNFTLVNDAYAELIGHDRKELIGSHASLVVPEDENMAMQAKEVQRDLEESTVGAKTYESASKTASGETINVDWTVAPLPEQEDSDHDRVVVVRDVTGRNERERQLQRQNERLDSFAGMLAHELRNPVNIGQIYSQQLPSEEDTEAVEYVTEAFDRIENMIDVMLVLARGREAVSEETPVHLADAAHEAWSEVSAPDATLEVKTDRTIEADDTYVRHLFRNLFDNAVEHGGSDVTVTVGDLSDVSADRSSGQRPRGDEASGGSTDESVGGFYVADDGNGIPATDREAIFETGYTTAGSRGGTGLGLTFVHEMADVYEWTCSVTEGPTGGAQFEFENVTTTQSLTK